MLSANKISLLFNEQVVFNDVSFTINSNDRIGLVGRNGSGKSTLFRVINGTQSLDSGNVLIEKGKSIAYVPQEIVLTSKRSVIDEAFSTFTEIIKLEAEIEALEQAGSDDSDSVDKYGSLHNRLIELDPDRARLDTKRLLRGLGFSEEQMRQSVASLSLGWKMRVVLIKALLKKADLYLFDEPTNHLDIGTKDWFLNFLKQSDFGFLLVCHDRYFLDHLCEKTFELDRGSLIPYKGNYSFYEEQRKIRIENLKSAYKQQQREIKKKKETIERFKASASKAKMAQSMMKGLARIDLIEIQSESKKINLSFGNVVRAGKVVLKVNDLSFAFGDKNIFNNVTFDIDRGDKVAIVAANGVGKTTLLNVVSGKYHVQSGSFEMGHKVTPAVFEQDQNLVLDPKKTILEEVGDSCSGDTRPLVRKFLGTFLFSGKDVNKRISVLSGGERNRVAMVKVLLQNANFLLLDEPTNHLDIESKDILLRALQQFGGTVLFVSHDRDFLNRVATSIIELTPDGASLYRGNYDDYLYQKYDRDILADHKVKKTVVFSSLSKKEAFARRKRLRNMESKIEKLEIKKKDLEGQISNLNCDDADYDNVYQQFIDCENSLNKYLLDWEELSNYLFEAKFRK